MKKKGLIIATIVMVLVLAISLTTATYAWFTATAQATISSMNIVTSASTGLQIGAVVYNQAAAPTVYNGTLDLNEAHHWVGTEENSYGSSLDLNPAEGTYLISSMYGATGDGVSMFAQTDKEKLLNTTDNPLKVATENVDFLALDFSLLATSNGQAYINQIYVNPAATKSGMAGSMRIALFATAAGDVLTSGSPTWSVATNGHMLYEPYGGLTYTGAIFSASAETTDYYTAAGTAGTIGTKAASKLQATWGNDKLVYGTSSATTGKTLTAVGNADAYTSLALANAALLNKAQTPAGIAKIGDVTAGQVIYLRLVIWFDGESKACVQEFAGGGATVQINFSLEPPVTP